MSLRVPCAFCSRQAYWGLQDSAHGGVTDSLEGDGEKFVGLQRFPDPLVDHCMQSGAVPFPTSHITARSHTGPVAAMVIKPFGSSTILADMRTTGGDLVVT